MDYNNHNRDRGFLSPDDRKYLIGEKEYKHRQSKYKRTEKVRSRFLNALLDFGILFESDKLDTRTIEDIFTVDSETERRALYRGLVGALATIYIGSHAFHPPFPGLLKSGVQRAENRLAEPGFREVSVEFDVQRGQRYFTEADVEYMAERVEEYGLSALTVEEQTKFLRYLYWNDSFNPQMAVEGFNQVDDRPTLNELRQQGSENARETKNAMHDRKVNDNDTE